ncbi:MAG: trypsin-like peptidase domain-containing protein [Oscillospiraceae bacterium]|nr:trypsin-like peptidase domain-containing protein [Oscillospiraceae bacterium]
MENNPENKIENKQQPYIKKKGKLRVVIAACLATVICGSAIGFGSSQLIIEIANIVESNSGGRNGDSNNRSDSSAKKITNFTLANITTAGSTEREMNGTELFEELGDTVVGIKLVNGRETSDIIGSGVITSEDGFIITCAHVIENADKVIVVVDDYEDSSLQHEYEAEVIGQDRPTDLAVLKIERKEGFKFARVGRSSELKIGQTVAAIGNPLGFVKTMTQGIVSGLQRDLQENAYMLPSIQTDTALNPGNSGCPLFDMYGNVVGIVNIKIVYGSRIDNLGFAISIDEAQEVISELVEHGLVFSRARLGITAMEVNEYNRAAYGITVEAGLFVETVSPDSDAAAQGLSRGDIIIKIDGQSVETVADIQSVIKDKNVGDEVVVNIVRYNNLGEGIEMLITFKLTNSG